jgi:hypothetical protein
MSAEAVATLRRTWEKLTFARVKRVIAREPEDVLSIEIPSIITTDEGLMIPNHTEYRIRSNRTKDIPKQDRWRARISWRHYYGFTDEDIYFQSDDCVKIDYDIGLTLDFGPRYVVNHTSGRFIKPEGEAVQAMVSL